MPDKKWLSIHFVAGERIANEIWQPVIAEAEFRGHKVSVDSNPNVRADIGFYCDDLSLPGPQKLTVISRNGLDQGHQNWHTPDIFFAQENWGLFDIGLLPGPYYAEMFSKAEPNSTSLPAMGAGVTGWPKADRLKSRAGLALEDVGESAVVLYAPNIECDGKQRDLIRALDGLGVKLLIKHWETPEEAHVYPSLLTNDYLSNLDAENEFADKFDWVEILPPESHIFDALEVSSILVSDRSSVLIEALAADVIPISVDNWRHNCPGKCEPPEYVAMRSTSDSLRKDIEALLKDFDWYMVRTVELKNLFFSHLGSSAKATLDFAESAYQFKVRSSFSGDAQRNHHHLRKEVADLKSQNKILKLELKYLWSTANICRPFRKFGRFIKDAFFQI